MTITRGDLNFTSDPDNMDIANKKLDLIHRLMLIWDEAALQRVATVIEKEVPEIEEDLPEEDLAELERRRTQHLNGETKPHSVEESMRLARRGFKL